MALYYYKYRLEVSQANEDLWYEIQEAFWHWRDEDAGDWTEQASSIVLEARTPDDDETFDPENEDWQQELYNTMNEANGSPCKTKLSYWLVQEGDENSIESEDPEDPDEDDDEDEDEEEDEGYEDVDNDRYGNDDW